MKLKFQYFTDAEGDYEFFKKQVTLSEILCFKEDDAKVEFRSDNPRQLLVFGGDVCDRGDDITLTETLIDLKERYPNRVVLIVGNRDANKTRFSTELPLDPNDKLDENLELVVTPPGARKSYKEYLGIASNSAINRLKWILECTMGSPTAFECRRKELMRIKKQEIISDEEVYLSFRQSVEPGGFMRKYLSLAQIGAVIGDTLIVHGGINNKNCGKVPNGFSLFEAENTKQAMVYVDKAVDWIDQLNNWYKLAIERWLDGPEPDKNYNYSNFVPASPLQHMSNDSGSYFEGQLPVVGNFLAEDRVTPSLLTKEVAAYLEKSGINRVMVGHQPNSGMPLFLIGTNNMPIDDRSIQIFTCDTLYGHRLAYDSEQGDTIRLTDPRGSSCAVVKVICNQDNSASYTSIKGIDGYGLQYERIIHYPRSEDEDPYIGRILKLNDKYFTVRVNRSGNDEKPYVLTHTAKNFAISYQYASYDELVNYSEAGLFLNENNRSLSKRPGMQ